MHPPSRTEIEGLSERTPIFSVQGIFPSISTNNRHMYRTVQALTTTQRINFRMRLFQRGNENAPHVLSRRGSASRSCEEEQEPDEEESDEETPFQ